jgi:ATP-dependent phosphofructokinase / diphosphate-dependent phosphofructokinase
VKKRPRIGILTGGGDCPGLNAVIRAVTKTVSHVYGGEVLGFFDGFRGIVNDDCAPLTFSSVSGLITEGGTILGTSNKDNFFGLARNKSQRNAPSKDRTRDAVAVFIKHKLDALVVVGGDGSLTVAHHLGKSGIPVVGVPKTIDNDVMHTDQTFGFDTASSIAAEAVDRLHSTAASHRRVMIVEVMGRDAGWIALQAGIAGGGDVILIPEIPYTVASVARTIKKRFAQKRRSSIVVVAEGAMSQGGAVYTTKSKNKAHPNQLGGVSQFVARDLEAATGIDCRAAILGYLQRGGTPTPYDRVLATRYGHAAAILAAENRFGRMVCLKEGRIEEVSLELVAGRPRYVPVDSPLIKTARDVGTAFGDE